VPDISRNLSALASIGVPYTQTDIDNAKADLRAQAGDAIDAGDLADRYPKAQIRDFDGNPQRLTEMDAVIAYLQMLGTLVDFESAAAMEDIAVDDPALRTPANAAEQAGIEGQVEGEQPR
jgi:cytochrome c oxidase cbb3-type subunit II